MRLHEQSLSVTHDLSDRLDAPVRVLAGAILGAAQDWADIWSEVSLSQKLEAQAELDEQLTELSNLGFFVLGGVQDMVAVLDQEEIPWPNALLLMRERSALETEADREAQHSERWPD